MRDAPSATPLGASVLGRRVAPGALGRPAVISRPSPLQAPRRAGEP